MSKEIIALATAIADRVYTGWAACGPRLREKVLVTAVDVLDKAWIDARKLKRDHAINEQAYKGTCAQFRIQVNSLKVSRARAQGQAADNAVSFHDLRLAISQWESRTGLDHNTLLSGVYKDPLGIRAIVVDSHG